MLTVAIRARTADGGIANRAHLDIDIFCLHFGVSLSLLCNRLRWDETPAHQNPCSHCWSIMSC